MTQPGDSYMDSLPNNAARLQSWLEGDTSRIAHISQGDAYRWHVVLESGRRSASAHGDVDKLPRAIYEAISNAQAIGL